MGTVNANFKGYLMNEIINFSSSIVCVFCQSHHRGKKSYYKMLLQNY